jgi:hypothetical protein
MRGGSFFVHRHPFGSAFISRLKRGGSECPSLLAEVV